VNGLLGLPVIVPHTSAGVALLLTYGARGPLGAPLGRIGLFFTDRLSGVVVAMLFVSVPFLVNAARDAFAALDPDLEQAAHCDGASAWQTAWHITMPLARRGIVGGALLMWARGISEFGAVVLLAYHPRTLAVLVYERFQGYGLARAAPLAGLLIVVALIVFAVAGSLLARADPEPEGPGSRPRRAR
jgi:molybdate/tungstate transport system permease protein